MWKVIESTRKKFNYCEICTCNRLEKRKCNNKFLRLQTNVNYSKESNHYNQLWLLNYDYSMPDNNEYSMSNESFSPVTIPVCVIHFFSTFTPNKIHLLCFISSAGQSCITPFTITSVCMIRKKYSDNYHCQLSVTSNSTYHSRAINAYFTGLISKIVLFYRSDYYFYTIILQQ